MGAPSNACCRFWEIKHERKMNRRGSGKLMERIVPVAMNAGSTCFPCFARIALLPFPKRFSFFFGATFSFMQMLTKKKNGFAIAFPAIVNSSLVSRLHLLFPFSLHLFLSYLEST